MCAQNASYLAKHSESGSKNLNRFCLKIIQKAVKPAITACKFSKIFRGSMPPDRPKAFLVFQSASKQFCQKKCARKKCENYAFTLFKFLATPLFMAKKLCGPLAHWQVTKWPATTNRFVTPALEQE